MRRGWSRVIAAVLEGLAAIVVLGATLSLSAVVAVSVAFYVGLGDIDDPAPHAPDLVAAGAFFAASGVVLVCGCLVAAGLLWASWRNVTALRAPG